MEGERQKESEDHSTTNTVQPTQFNQQSTTLSNGAEGRRVPLTSWALTSLSWSATNLSTKELFIRPYKGGRRRKEEEGGENMMTEEVRGGRKRILIF